jgi:hypothetical protein
MAEAAIMKMPTPTIHVHVISGMSRRKTLPNEGLQRLAAISMPLVLFALLLMAQLPSAMACTCGIPNGDQSDIDDADIAFVGELVEVRNDPHSPAGVAFGILNWFLDGDKALGRMELVFDVAKTIKGQPARRQTIIDGTRYHTSCDNGPPSLTGAIGQTYLVTAARYPWKRPVSGQDPAGNIPGQAYAVTFTFCSHALKYRSVSQTGTHLSEPSGGTASTSSVDKR